MLGFLLGSGGNTKVMANLFLLKPCPLQGLKSVIFPSPGLPRYSLGACGPRASCSSRDRKVRMGTEWQFLPPEGTFLTTRKGFFLTLPRSLLIGRFGLFPRSFKTFSVFFGLLSPGAERWFFTRMIPSSFLPLLVCSLHLGDHR